MKKIIFMGKSGAGKTSIIEALRGQKITYHKTQYIYYDEDFIDTPGEYTQGRELGAALAVYSYEADVVGLVICAEDDYCIFPPACAPVANRPVVGIVTQCDGKTQDQLDISKHRLLLCGCERVFFTSAKTGLGVQELLDYLK